MAERMAALLNRLIPARFAILATLENSTAEPRSNVEKRGRSDTDFESPDSD